MARHKHRPHDPDQFDLFEPPHECCEGARGAYLQFIIAPPTELAGAGYRIRQENAPGSWWTLPGALTAS